MTIGLALQPVPLLVESPSHETVAALPQQVPLALPPCAVKAANVVAAAGTCARQLTVTAPGQLMVGKMSSRSVAELFPELESTTPEAAVMVTELVTWHEGLVPTVAWTV
jgi:hypothetical protein